MLSLTTADIQNKKQMVSFNWDWVTRLMPHKLRKRQNLYKIAVENEILKSFVGGIISLIDLNKFWQMTSGRKVPYVEPIKAWFKK